MVLKTETEKIAEDERLKEGDEPYPRKTIPEAEEYDPKRELPTKFVLAGVDDNPACIDVYLPNEHKKNL